MVRYDPHSKLVNSTDLGRCASNYYIACETMDEFCTKLKIFDDDGLFATDVDEQLFMTMAQSKEFEQLRVRREEIQDLRKIKDMLGSIEGAVLDSHDKSTIKEGGSMATQ